MGLRPIWPVHHSGLGGGACHSAELYQNSSMQGPASWTGKYYKYRLEVYSPWSQRMKMLEATDPYSRSLAADGARTQVRAC